MPRKRGSRYTRASASVNGKNIAVRTEAQESDINPVQRQDAAQANTKTVLVILKSVMMALFLGFVAAEMLKITHTQRGPHQGHAPVDSVDVDEETQFFHKYSLQIWDPSTATSNASTVIQNHFAATMDSLEHSEKLQFLQTAEPLMAKLRTQLKPIYERLAGLKAQCLHYERMGHMAGGPTNFIFNAKKEVYTQILQRMAILRNELVDTIRNINQSSIESCKRWIRAEKDLLRPDDSLFYKHMLPMLREGLALKCVGPVADARAQIENLIEPLKDLPKLFEEYEKNNGELWPRLEVLKHLTNSDTSFPLLLDPEAIAELPDEQRLLVEPAMNKCKKSYFRLLTFLFDHEEVIKAYQICSLRIQQTTVSLLDTIKDARVPYWGLYIEAKAEVNSLLVRIDSLKYKYDKKKIAKSAPKHT